MSENVGVAIQKLPWSLRVLYAMLLVSAVALLILVAGEIIKALESDEGELHEEGELHHFFLFDLAWPVFLLSGLLTLAAGVVALPLGAVRNSPSTLRYGAWALGYCVVAVVVVIASEALGS